MIQQGSKVSIEYTLKLEDGSTADTNVGGNPLTYEQGKGEILPALENELLGLKPEDTKQVELAPESGYGAVNPEAFQRVPVTMVPEDARRKGAQLVAQAPDGAQMMVRVDRIEDSEAVLDLNHPLAGRTLHFDVRIVAVE